jgi:hypothetical protein
MTIKAGTQTILETVVDAAAKAIYLRHTGTDWDNETEQIRAMFRRDAEAALEASAPEIRTAALSEAADIIASEEREQWRLAERFSTGSQMVAQRMQVLGKIIRGRAEQPDSLKRTPYAKGGVIEGGIPHDLVVRHLPGNDYREYWDAELGQWVRIFTWEQVRILGTKALEDFVRISGTGAPFIRRDRSASDFEARVGRILPDKDVPNV